MARVGPHRQIKKKIELINLFILSVFQTVNDVIICGPLFHIFQQTVLLMHNSSPSVGFATCRFVRMRLSTTMSEVSSFTFPGFSFYSKAGYQLWYNLTLCVGTKHYLVRRQKN